MPELVGAGLRVRFITSGFFGLVQLPQFTSAKAPLLQFAARVFLILQPPVQGQHGAVRSKKNCLFGEIADYCVGFKPAFFVVMVHTLALLDDHRVVLESFANLLATSGHFRVVGLAHDGPSLFAILDQNSVDVLVTDLIMPTVNGAELIPTVKARFPNLAILVLSGSDDPVLIRRVMQAGADGYVTKTADKSELFEAILAVAAGRRYLDSRVFSMETEPTTVPAKGLLSPREVQIVDLILEELSSTQIAERLFISFNTVETHRKRIYQKLGVNTSLGLLKYTLSHKSAKR